MLQHGTSRRSYSSLTFGLLTQHHKIYCNFSPYWNIYLFQVCWRKCGVVSGACWRDELELLIGTGGVNKLLVQGDSSWQSVGTWRTCVILSQSFSSRTSRWGTPFYCLLISCFVSPIATWNATYDFSATPLTWPLNFLLCQQQPLFCSSSSSHVFIFLSFASSFFLRM